MSIENIKSAVSSAYHSTKDTVGRLGNNTVTFMTCGSLKPAVTACLALAVSISLFAFTLFIAYAALNAFYLGALLLVSASALSLVIPPLLTGIFKGSIALAATVAAVVSFLLSIGAFSKSHKVFCEKATPLAA